MSLIIEAREALSRSWPLAEEQVEAACRAHAPQWDGIDPGIQVYARQQMRRAIEAALRASPPIGKWRDYVTDKPEFASVEIERENGFREVVYAHTVNWSHRRPSDPFRIVRWRYAAPPSPVDEGRER